MAQKYVYPEARRDESVVDDYFGAKVADPYRWLEDPYSAETRKFVAAEDIVARLYVENNGFWHYINKKLAKTSNYPKYSVPIHCGDYYFTFQNTGLQNQDVLYKQKTLQSELIEVLNPNKLSADRSIELHSTSLSPNGNYLAYGLSENGSDWITIKIRDVRTGEDFPDVLTDIKFSTMSWTHDNKGLFYCRFVNHVGKRDGTDTQVNSNQKLYYHRLGESQDKDVLVAEFPEHPLCRIAASVTDCGKYLVLMVSTINTRYDNLVFVADLEKSGEIRGKLPLTPIITNFEAMYQYVTSIGSKVVFRTNKNAPNYRLISIDLNDPTEAKWTTLLAEDTKDVLQWAHIVDSNKLVVHYLHDVKSALRVYDLNTGKFLREFPLGVGQVSAFSSSGSEIFYKFESFLTPGTIYRFDFATPDIEPQAICETKLNGFDENNFNVEQVFYSSRDGTKIPMFIVQKKTASDNGGAKPCLLYGYGGFNNALQPHFNATWMTFVDAFNGVLAIPNIRGGGEYGTKWHLGGLQLTKQNCYDDFQAAADYLVKNCYSIPKKIGIQGWSNGGLMVTVCMNQRPELFGAAVSQYGVMDLLRFHKFAVGPQCSYEFGHSADKVHFENILKYSSLHNVRSPTSSDKQYPAALIMAGDHDDRACPHHSYKFAAEVQHAVKGNKFQTNPILLRIYKDTGHGLPAHPTAKELVQGTDILTFLYKSLNINCKI